MFFFNSSPRLTSTCRNVHMSQICVCVCVWIWGQLPLGMCVGCTLALCAFFCDSSNPSKCEVFFHFNVELPDVSIRIDPGRLNPPDGNGPVCQDWAVDWAQNSPHQASADQTPIPYNPVASSRLKPKGRWVCRADAPVLTNRTSLAWAANPINTATPVC